MPWRLPDGIHALWHGICWIAGKTVILPKLKRYTDRMANNNQPGAGTGAQTRDRVRIQEPHQYKVLFHNDDFTTMEFVTQVLQRVFGKPVEEAVAIMMKVHREGHAVVGVYSYDVAMTKAALATAQAREQGFPLRITCEPA